MKKNIEKFKIKNFYFYCHIFLAFYLNFGVFPLTTLNAGVPMLDFVCGVCVGLFDGRSLVDLTHMEQSSLALPFLSICIMPNTRTEPTEPEDTDQAQAESMEGIDVVQLQGDFPAEGMGDGDREGPPTADREGEVEGAEGMSEKVPSTAPTAQLLLPITDSSRVLHVRTGSKLHVQHLQRALESALGASKEIYSVLDSFARAHLESAVAAKDSDM